MTARTTLQTRVTSSETVSGWSQFSGFTYYMTPIEQRDRASRMLANANAVVSPGDGAGLAMMEQPSPLESVRETETPSVGGESKNSSNSSSEDESEEKEDSEGGMVCQEAAERESAFPIGHAI